MRKKQTALLLAGAICLLAACGSAGNAADTSSDVPVVPASMIAVTEIAEDSKVFTEQISGTEVEIEAEGEPENGSEDSSDSEKEAESQEKYQEIISTYQKLFAGRKEESAYTAAQLNSLAASYYPEDNQNSGLTVGYALIDLEENGMYNLIIGVNGSSLKGTQILDLYTLSNGEVVHLCSSTKNDKYYPGTDGRIYLEGSSGGMDKHFYQYDIENSYLAVCSEFAYDGSLQEDSPWYVIEGDSYISITDEEAEEKITSFRNNFRTIDLNTF